MYKQWLAVKDNFKPMFITILFSSLLSVTSVIVLGMLFSLPPGLTASLVPMGITTPIAIAVTQPLGGNPSITSVVVIGVGLFGNVLGPFLLNNIFRVRWDPARGLALGQSSHGIGTARAVQINDIAGTFSGLAMSINGVITVFTAPLVWTLIQG